MNAQNATQEQFKLTNNFNHNTEYSETSPAFFKQDIVYASTKRNASRDLISFDSKKNRGYDMFVKTSKKKSNNGFKSNKLGIMLSTRDHDSNAAFNADGTVVYFTRTNNKISSIYKSVQNPSNGKWSKPEKVTLQGQAYNMANPSLSPDEKTLYFSSNMPGSVGGTDIYQVSISGNHHGYSRPKNLVQVNTKGNDTYPFIDKKGNLYFSSDGYAGSGGYDIYKASIESNFENVSNLGAPINSEHDDVCFIIDSTTNTGYFASNRSKSIDIFSFEANLKASNPFKTPKNANVITFNYR